MRIAIVGSLAKSLVNFRGPLLEELASLGHTVYGMAPEQDPEVSDTLRRMGVGYRAIAMDRRGLNPTRDLGTIMRLEREFRALKPDVVLSYTMKPVVYASFAGSAVGAKVFSIITGLGRSFSEDPGRGLGLQRTALELLLRTSLRQNEAVFFQNRDDQSLFVSRGIVPSDATSLVDGSGVRLGAFPAHPVPAGAPTCLLLARLIRSKGIEHYVEAARLVRKQRPDVRFRLAGAYEQGEDAIAPERVRQWVEEGVIEYLGEVSDVRGLLEASSVVVLPSYYREGVPRSLIEGLATGRPIVTTDLPGCREVVVDGENGSLVPPHNPKLLADALLALTSDPERLRRYGARSRKLAEERFDVRRVNKAIINRMFKN